MTDIVKPGRGGARAGAGRKPSGTEARVSISLSARQDDVYLLEDAGDGNVSLGLRMLIDELLLLRSYKRGVPVNAGTSPTPIHVSGVNTAGVDAVKKKAVAAAPRFDRVDRVTKD